MSYRHLIRAVAALAILSGITVSQEASAQRYSAQELNYYCSLGSETPRTIRPYCGRGGGYEPRHVPRREYHDPEPDYGSYGGRRLRRDDLAYYCSMGSQTPRSIRRYCGQYGY